MCNVETGVRRVQKDFLKFAAEAKDTAFAQLERANYRDYNYQEGLAAAFEQAAQTLQIVLDDGGRP